MLKPKMMLCVSDVAAGRRRLHISSLSVMREATTASGVIMQPPRLADTARTDYFTLRERLIGLRAKTTGRNPEVY